MVGTTGTTDVLAQAQAIAAYPTTHAIARVPVGEAVLIKQYLDVGAQTLLIPMVDTPEHAALMVRDYVKWDDYPMSLQHFAESFL